MTVALYVNSQGKEVTHSSYSSRQEFKHCPRKFQLTRIIGWQDKEKRAAPLFGKAIEAAVEFFEASERKTDSGIEHFARLWHDVTTLPEFDELKYTDSEGDWESLLRAGKELLKLYEIRAPFLPISTWPKAAFQQTLRKKIFPGSEYDILENKAIFDILSFPRWNHPLLSPISENENPTRPLIIDIKTSGDDLDTRLIALDPQLCEYAWQAKIPDVGFLWFVKHGHSLRQGSRVTLLEDAYSDERLIWYAGYELIVLKAEEQVYVGEPTTLEEYKQKLSGTRGKAREAVETVFLIESMNLGKVVAVEPVTLTKQRLQFAAARLSEQDMNEIGRDVAQTTVEMIRANNENYYPKTGGVRFPNQKCPFCPMRFICLNDDESRDKFLTKKGEEWMNIEQDGE